MNKFAGVTVARAANIYFDGRVTSRTLEFPDGSVKTLGIMLPGDYTFHTRSAEQVEVTSGFALVQIAGTDIWEEFREGGSLQIPANTSFRVCVQQLLDYTCTYL